MPNIRVVKLCNNSCARFVLEKPLFVLCSPYSEIWSSNIFPSTKLQSEIPRNPIQLNFTQSKSRTKNLKANQSEKQIFFKNSKQFENGKRYGKTDKILGFFVNPSGPGWENGHKILWPFSDLALLSLRTIKKHLKHCNYDSAIKFELAGVGKNKIILLFRDKN